MRNLTLDHAACELAKTKLKTAIELLYEAATLLQHNNHASNPIGLNGKLIREFAVAIDRALTRNGDKLS